MGLRQIADRVGMSVCTVSRVLNSSHGHASHAPGTVEKIRRAADELGYRPNLAARSLRTGLANAVGIISPNAYGQAGSDAFLAAMIASIDASAHRLGMHLSLVGVSKGRQPVEAGIEAVLEKRIDGLIVPGFGLGTEDVTRLENADCPVVLLHCDRATSLPSVGLDSAAGIRAAVSHLAELGHRRIAWVGSASGRWSSVEQERRTAFEEAVADHGMEGLRIDRSESEPPPKTLAARIEASARLAGTLDWRGAGITGGVCFNDVVALGVYAAASAAGLSIPADLSVVGFDDLYAETALPPMTTIRHMLGELGQEAVHLVAEWARTSKMPLRNGDVTRIVPGLVVRRSTGPPRDSSTGI